MKNIYISLDDHSMVSNMRKDNDNVCVGEVVDYICKLQAVENAAEHFLAIDSRCGMQSKTATIWNDLALAKAGLSETLKALKPKTTEQLLAELLEAAENTVDACRPLNVDESRALRVYEYEAAKKAYEASL